MPKWKASHFFRKMRTVQMPTKTGQHTASRGTVEPLTGHCTLSVAPALASSPPSSHPPSAPLAPARPSRRGLLCSCARLKLAELQKAVLPGWVVFAASALPPAASPFLEHRWEAARTPLAPPAAHPQAASFNHSEQPLRSAAGNPVLSQLWEALLPKQ